MLSDDPVLWLMEQSGPLLARCKAVVVLPRRAHHGLTPGT